MAAERIEISGEAAEALLARVKDVLPDEDYRIIKGLIDTHLLLNQAVSEKSTSIKRLLKMIFGSKTEKAKNGGNTTGSKRTDKKEKKAKGHGRNGANNYTGAETIAINHQTLQHCDPCPACEDGRLYRQSSPGVVVRIKGTAPCGARCMSWRSCAATSAARSLRQICHPRPERKSMTRRRPPCWPSCAMAAACL